jgi:hypothetical protein
MSNENRDGKTLSKNDFHTLVPPTTVTANNIASRLICVSKAHMDKNHARATKSSIHGFKSTLTTDPAVSANFNTNELESALKSVKLETAAGFYGVNPELISFMNDILSLAKLPKWLKRVKVIAIP